MLDIHANKIIANKFVGEFENNNEYIDYVIETKSFENGSWYRLYKSGWLEQGGKIENSTNQKNIYTFLKPFANIPTITTNFDNQYYANQYNGPHSFLTEITALSFAHWTGITSYTRRFWFACGMGI